MQLLRDPIVIESGVWQDLINPENQINPLSTESKWFPFIHSSIAANMTAEDGASLIRNEKAAHPNTARPVWHQQRRRAASMVFTTCVMTLICSAALLKAFSFFLKLVPSEPRAVCFTLNFQTLGWPEASCGCCTRSSTERCFRIETHSMRYVLSKCFLCIYSTPLCNTDECLCPMCFLQPLRLSSTLH